MHYKHKNDTGFFLLSCNEVTQMKLDDTTYQYRTAFIRPRRSLFSCWNEVGKTYFAFFLDLRYYYYYTVMHRHIRRPGMLPTNNNKYIICEWMRNMQYRLFKARIIIHQHDRFPKLNCLKAQTIILIYTQNGEFQLNL